MRLWEAARQISSKLQRYIKPNANVVANSLLSHIIDIDGKFTRTIVTDKDKIYQLLVESNIRKLSMSNNSPFGTDPLSYEIGPYGDNTIVDKIIDDTATHATLGLYPHDVNDKTFALLTSLQYTTPPTG